MRITAITPEQEARFQEWREKWIRIGLSIETADFDRAEKAALKAYALCNLEPPKVILRMGSPYGATVGGVMALLAIQQTFGTKRKLRNTERRMKRQVLPQIDLGLDQEAWNRVLQKNWQELGHQVRQAIERHVHRCVQQQVKQQVWQQVCQRVLNQVWQQVEQQVWHEIWHQILYQAWKQAWHRIWQQVEPQLWWQVWPQLGQQIKRRIGQQVLQKVEQQFGLRPYQQTVFDVAKGGFHRQGGGPFLAGWCAYVTFMRDVLGLRDLISESFAIEEDLAISCGWVWWNKDVLAISDRPSEIHLDAEGRLHNENGPSIAYLDGWKLYHVHGVAVPDFVVERPDTIKIEHVEREPNVEVRRVMIAKIGLERFIRESGLKPIHSDDFGTLYRKEMPGDEPLVVVKVVNSTPEPGGSRKEYFLRVPPTMKRAREAVAWTFGMKEKEYRPATET